MERDELTDLLTRALRGRPGDELLEGRVQAGQVKSRLLEAHPPEASPDGVKQLLRDVADPAGLQLMASGDELWELHDDDTTFFVDTLHPRFWLLHTTARKAALDSLVRQHVLGDPRLDSAWLPWQELNRLEGERRWLKASSSPAQLDESGEVPRRFRFQLEDDDPAAALALLATSERYAASASFTGVASVLDEPELGRASVAADYRGGFAATGTSFEPVASLLWSTLDRYEAFVGALETRHQLRTEAVAHGGLLLTGELAFIPFPRRVTNLELFVRRLFNCREPFRLWAVPREVSPGQWEANTVDLHVGQTLRMELTDRWLRIFLDDQTCGNTLARLVANLQHRFDARVALPSANVGIASRVEA